MVHVRWLEMHSHRQGADRVRPRWRRAERTGRSNRSAKDGSSRGRWLGITLKFVGSPHHEDCTDVCLIRASKNG